jgi:TonB family protein
MIRLAIAILLGLLMIATDVFAQENAPSSAVPPGSQSQAPSTEDHRPPSTPLGAGPGPSATFKVCGAKNPPPCATPPRVIKSPNPDYSKEARKKNVEGTAVLWLIVGADGLPRDIRITRPVGYGLDEKAIEAVKKWKFKPSTLDGHAVAVQINVELTFRLY